jgi:hypothetical protein
MIPIPNYLMLDKSNCQDERVVRIWIINGSRGRG